MPLEHWWNAPVGILAVMFTRLSLVFSLLKYVERAEPLIRRAVHLWWRWL